MKKYRVPAILLALVCLLCACQPDAPAATTTQTQAQASSTASTAPTVPVPVPTVTEPADLEAELWTQIEAAWLAQFGDLPTYEGNTKPIFTNYGNYEDYTIIKIYPPDGVVAGVGMTLKIGHISLYSKSAMALYVYRNGSFRPLPEEFEEGLISTDALDRCKAIHDWHEEQMVRSQIAERLEALLGREPVWYEEDVKTGLRYYGSYMLCPVLFVPDSGGSTELTVGSVTFRSYVPFKLYMLGNTLIPLEDAFAQNKLADYHLDEIFAQHVKYE